MKTNILKIVTVVGTIILLLNVSCKNKTIQSLRLPDGWHHDGFKPENYIMGIEKSNVQEDKYTATIKSINIKKNKVAFGTLSQACYADKYLGKRIRMSGYIKSENVTRWAGFWLRVSVDSVEVSFDNMYDVKKNRSIKGTTNWTKYDIVLDVPLNATELDFGAWLGESGQIWFKNLTFEIVDNSIETTGYTKISNIQNPKKRTGLKAEPYNLNFEK